MMQMKSAARWSVVLAVLLTLNSCRQPDAVVPEPRDDDPDRIEDIAADLRNVARGDTDGPRDLADDLGLFVQERPAAQPAVSELATRLTAAVSGTSLDDPTAAQLARHLWTAVTIRDLSGRQVETLQQDVRTTLAAAGVPEERAAPVADQVAEVQRTVNERPRRWYQWY